MRTRPALALTVTALVLAACGGATAGDATPASDADSPSEAVEGSYPRTVEHALGSAEIPAAPERVVAITGTAELDPLLLLDHPPVAAAVVDEDLDAFSAHLDGLTEGIEQLGSRREIDVEAIAAYEPDLILGTVGWLEEIQDLLEQVAPTVAVDDGQPWQDVLRLVAQTVAEEDAAEAHIEAVDARVEALAEEHADALDGRTYTLLRPFPADGENGVYVNTDVNRLLDDLGMSVSEQVAADTPDDDVYVGYSLERTEPLATDVILAYTYGDEENDGAIEDFQQAPVNQTLPAVAEDRVVVVNAGWWYLTSAIGIERVLDEFEADVLPLLLNAEAAP